MADYNGKHRQDDTPADKARADSERTTSEAERRAMEDTAKRLRNGDWGVARS